MTGDQTLTKLVPHRRVRAIGLELAFGEIMKVGWKPVFVYFLSTVVNTFLALGAAYLLFGNIL